MKLSRSIMLLWSVALATIMGSGVGCGPTHSSSPYVGRWECSDGGGDFLEIKATSDGFLVTDERGKTKTGKLDANAEDILLVPNFLGMWEPYHIDSRTGDLVWGGGPGGCRRYKKAK